MVGFVFATYLYPALGVLGKVNLPTRFKAVEAFEITGVAGLERE